jgi:type IV pilus assembly protein PilC
MLDAIGQDLEREPSLAKALERHASTFGPETVAFVGAAEGQNALAGGLAMLADDYERRQQFIRLPISLLWPLFLLGFLALIMMLLMIFVIPAFKEVFNSFGADLPGATLAVMAISDMVVAYWWILFALVIALPFGVAYLRRRSGLGMALDGAFLKLPGVRRFLVGLLVGRMTALLAGAAANRIPFTTTIAYLQSTLGNRSLKAVVAALGRDVEQGASLSAAWRKQPLLPRRIARMVDIGERSDKLAPVLARAARVHGAEAANAIAFFRQALFVTTYVLAGIIVGFMVIAMYLPIFRLGSVV